MRDLPDEQEGTVITRTLRHASRIWAMLLVALSAQPIGARATPQERTPAIERVIEIRRALLARDQAAHETDQGPTRLAQWFNFPNYWMNWPNWNNWRNWLNF